MNFKTNIKDNLKNILGWRTKRKLIIFAVDDYGNVRLDSKTARVNLEKEGLKASSRFDNYDSLETTEDLDQLFSVLSSVKDKNKNYAVFTPYTLPCNIDFESIRSNKYKAYSYELLPETFRKLSSTQPKAYEGAWELWIEGIEKKLLSPEFHGREHLNLKVFETKLNRRDPDLMASLKNRSYSRISQNDYSTISWTAAFAFVKSNDIKSFPRIITSGLKSFESIFGFSPSAFTPPSQQFHPSLVSVLWDNKVKAIDRPFMYKQHLGDGVYKRAFSSTKIDKITCKITLVRNVLFEPTIGISVDWVDFSLKQIETAFRWNKPAIISSHRVNFCGHIDPQNRKRGLEALQALLQQIVKRWPDAEFISVGELVKVMQKENSVSRD